MTFLLSLIIVIFVFLVIQCAKRIARQIELTGREEIKNAKEAHNQLIRKKESLSKEKYALEGQALEIFTLYEITKEITKSLNEQDAFDIFKQKLSLHTVFEECLFLAPSSPSINELKKSEEYFIFTLQEKRKKIGYLAIKGVPEQDKEKIMILGHQFALAIRRVKLYQEIEKVAITDSLTEVQTRHYALVRFTEEINRSKERKIKMSFLMIDADFFKSINDEYGHLTGDQVLKEIAAIIKENIREIDIAGRYGGEEFCVVLPDTDREGAQYAAERIRSATEQALIKAYDTQIKTTVSVGIATFPEDGKSMEELIDKADWALYRAKKQGRNRICSFGVYE